MYHRDSSFIAKCRTVRHDLMSVPEFNGEIQVPTCASIIIIPVSVFCLFANKLV